MDKLAVCISFLNNILENDTRISTQERAFAYDLYRLLDKKCLRDHEGVLIFFGKESLLIEHQYIFFEAKTAKYRGDFLGFIESLSLDQHFENSVWKTIFSNQLKKAFHPYPISAI